jgi:hypothetical protein
MEGTVSKNSTSNRRPNRHSKSTPTVHIEQVVFHQLLRMPGNETTPLTNALISNLKASHDLRYHLSWTYGGFIEDIPRRLGTNEALDAAVAALLSSHSSLNIRRGTGELIPIEAMSKYTHALKTLRITLGNPELAREANTLCAVMLLLICQSFIGTYVGGWSSHGEGAAQIIKARAYYDTRDEFECKLLLSLRGPVLFESLYNTKISFTPGEWKRLVENELDGSSPEGVMMCCLARAPDLMNRGRNALRKGASVESLISETRDQYQTLTGVLGEMHERLKAFQELLCSKNSLSALSTIRLHSLYQRTHGLALAICIIFNCILSALDPGNTELDNDSFRFCRDALDHAVLAAEFRPLGASYVTLCLMVAWCGCRDQATKVMIEKTLEDYRSDFPAAPEETFKDELEGTLRRLNLSDP